MICEANARSGRVPKSEQIPMCRWLAYMGTPVVLEELLYRPKHSLIDQSLHAQLGAQTTNGDGFGVGWYAEGKRPALYRSVETAWSDQNFRELAGHIQAGLVFAHVRASTGTPVQRSNCHPFRHGKWLWMHNGAIARFQEIKRELILAVDPSLYAKIEGSTDSEVLFFLALTFGLAEGPPAAVQRAVGFIERLGYDRGIEDPIHMTVAASDGQKVWAFRYSSGGRSSSLFYSSKTTTLQAQYPDNPIFHNLSSETRLVISEPLSDLAGVWHEVPESSYGVIWHGQDELKTFTPQKP